MAKQIISRGTGPDTGTGDSPYTGVGKINENFTELYDALGAQLALNEGLAPKNNPIFTGTVQGVTKSMVGLGNVDNVADASKPVSTPQGAAIVAGDNLRLKVDDVYSDFVSSGLATPVPLNALDGVLSAGVAYVLGERVEKVASDTFTYLATRDTYVDVSNTGAITRVPVVNGAAEPAVTANSLRLEKVVTDTTKIALVVSRSNRVVPFQRGILASDAWMTIPSFFRLRLTGTGTVTVDAKDSLGNITAGIASYTLSGATDQIEFPYAGDNAVAIRATLTGSATAEVI